LFVASRRASTPSRQMLVGYKVFSAGQRSWDGTGGAGG
jgi:hypothetical protein